MILTTETRGGMRYGTALHLRCYVTPGTPGRAVQLLLDLWQVEGVRDVQLSLTNFADWDQG